MRKLGEQQAKLYKERAKMTAKIKDFEARAQDLKVERAIIDDRILQGALKNGGRRKLPNGKILKITRTVVDAQIVTDEMVGDTIRKGYTRFTWSEQEPEDDIDQANRELLED